MNELIDCVANHCGEFFFAALVHHHVRHATHQVFAEANLRVHHSTATHHFASCEINEVTCHSCRSDVDGDAEDGFNKPWPSGNDVACYSIIFRAFNCNGRTAITFVNRSVHLGKRSNADGWPRNVMLLCDCIANDLRRSDVITKF